jgi:hypothetical protein
VIVEVVFGGLVDVLLVLLMLLPSTLFVTEFIKAREGGCLSWAHTSIVVHRWLLLG